MAADGYRTDWLQAEQGAGSRRHVQAMLADLRRRHRVHGQTVLELGSGLGDNLAVFVNGNQVLGLEALAEAAGAAQQRGIPTRQADLSCPPWPLPAGRWDWVLALDVLEHLIDPQAALVEARRWLAPDGHLVINIPNHFNWRGRWRLLRGSGIDSVGYFPGSPPWAYPHLRFFRHAEVLALLRVTGFEVIEDLSALQPCLPGFRHWPKSAGRLAGRWPDLAASGFFVLARQRPGLDAEGACP